MIKFEDTQVEGFEPAIRGMRNPKNSWNRSDSFMSTAMWDLYRFREGDPEIGPNDLKLMKGLVKAGTDHRKFMRMITVYVDITAPLYWWKEFDTYKVGTVANSCSTMHKLADKEFALDDFSHEHLGVFGNEKLLQYIISQLNIYRKCFVEFDDLKSQGFFENHITKKDCWWQMIQLLPSSYNQKRTIMMNYEVLANIYKSRKNHKLDEWKEHDDETYYGFCDWIKSLPYSELITGEFKD